MVATAFPVFSTKSRIMKVKQRERERRREQGMEWETDRQTERGEKEGGE